MNVVLGKARLANSNSIDLQKEGLQLSKRTRMRFHRGVMALTCRAAPHNGQVNPAYEFVNGRGETNRKTVH